MLISTDVNYQKSHYLALGCTESGVIGVGRFWPGFMAIRMHAIVGSFPAITLLFETNKTSTNIISL
jgi:hypothetical protein